MGRVFVNFITSAELVGFTRYRQGYSNCSTPCMSLVTFKVEAPKPIIEQCVYTSSYLTWSMEITQVIQLQVCFGIVYCTNLSTFGKPFCWQLTAQKHLNTTNPLQEISPNHPPARKKHSSTSLCFEKFPSAFLVFLLGGKR